jgi:cysteine-rich repeat protein
MYRKPRSLKLSRAALAAALMFGNTLALAETGTGSSALAGQMCPGGSYVIGFDAAGDIVCSEACGNGVVNAGEACDDGNRLNGDGCSDACQPETSVTGGKQAAAAVAPAAAAAPAAPATSTAPAMPAAAATPDTGPAISDIEPSNVLYGTRELALVVIGSGFTADSVIEFAGARYTPSVNPEGTRLEVTLATRNLAMGRYPVTVSNGAGQKATLKRALVVY